LIQNRRFTSGRSRCSGLFFSPSNFFLPGAIAILLLLIAGCQKPSIKKSQLRAVTNEIVASSQRVSGSKSDVTVHRGNADTIFVSLVNPMQKVALQRELSEIAERHKLSIVEISSGGVDSFELDFDGRRTHIVRVVTPLSARKIPAPGKHSATLAIIIDDLGNDRSAGNAVISLPFPVTVSVLPHLSFSSDIAEEAHRRGDEVLLHLPMEPESSKAQTEQSELRVGMSAPEVRDALSSMLETVPHVVGVNNHEGSRATSDPTLMAELMPALQERNLFFIDSRTSASSVAYNAAKSAGVASASRKVFLDDNTDKGAIVAQIQLAVRDAERDGSAIAIGHPHPSTIVALGQSAGLFEDHGVRLVFASDLAR
jgi:hypothetical protein